MRLLFVPATYHLMHMYPGDDNSVLTTPYVLQTTVLLLAEQRRKQAQRGRHLFRDMTASSGSSSARMKAGR